MTFKKHILNLLILIVLLFSFINVNAMSSNLNIDTSPVGGSVTLYFDTGVENLKLEPMILGVGTAPQTYELPIPVRDEYSFDGWYTEDNKLVTNENPYIAFNIVKSGESATVYAKWIKNTSNITPVGGSVTLQFDSNGGTKCEDLTLGVGTAPQIYELPIPLKIGYKFEGWYTKDDKLITGENPYLAFDIVQSGQKATVYAKWTEVEKIKETNNTKRENIDNSEEYYQITETTILYADSSKIVTVVKDRMLKEFIIESFTETTYYYSNGTTETTNLGLYNGYDDYNRKYAKHSLDVTVKDTAGNPIKDVCILFKTEKETIKLYTDKNGKINYEFEKNLKHSTEIILPNGYVLAKEPEKLGLGCMYSIIFREDYVLKTDSIVENPDPIIDVVDDTTPQTGCDISVNYYIILFLTSLCFVNFFNPFKKH